LLTNGVVHFTNTHFHQRAQITNAQLTNDGTGYQQRPIHQQQQQVVGWGDAG
jgi:hypothetical protein